MNQKRNKPAGEFIEILEELSNASPDEQSFIRRVAAVTALWLVAWTYFFGVSVNSAIYILMPATAVALALSMLIFQIIHPVPVRKWTSAEKLAGRMDPD